MGRWVVPGVFVATVLVAVSFGRAEPLSGRLAALLSVWLGAGWTPAAYLLGALGWGRVARGWTRTIPDAWAAWGIEAGVGVGLTLAVSHGLGAMGVLGPAAAWLWTGAGLAMLALAMTRRAPAARPATPRVLLALASVGLGVLLVAAASPPGALWDSEFGGYDALSYHLQLPAEWLASGRIEPAAHNVYSYLPGYYEAAVVHLAHLRATPGLTPTGLSGLVAGDGAGVMSAHLLAAGMSVLGAALTGLFARAVAARAGLDEQAAALAAFAAGGLVLVTPWTQVVGSLAYNEPGVLALGAAGLLAACTPGLTPVRRGMLVAFLVGSATGCKPTAVLFLAPCAGVLMAASEPARRWPSMFAVGVAVGLLTLAPWMARNAGAGGNPVFPYAGGLFGHAHWTPDQAARYAGGHHFAGGVGDRLATAVLPAAPPGSPSVERWRGLTNPQWALTPWAGLAGMLVLLRVRTRAGGVLLAGTGLALAAWLVFTHLQSRFLLPLLPVFGAGFGAGLGALPGRVRTPLAVGVLAVGGAWSLVNFAAQRDGEPNALLTLGPGVLTGSLGVPGIGDGVVWAGVNETLPPGEGLLLVGDATPLYLRRPLSYATVWDAHPLAAAMRAEPDDPRAWTRALAADGHAWALVSFGEIDRLASSGWADPVLTPERVADWTAALGHPVRIWPGQGRALYRLGSPR